MGLHTYIIRILNNDSQDNSVLPLNQNKMPAIKKAEMVNKFGRIGFIILMLVPTIVCGVLGHQNFHKFKDVGTSCPYNEEKFYH